MKVTLENGQLHIDIYEAMRGLSLEEKRQLADTLACQDDVIELVAQQIITGWTEFDSHGGIGESSVYPKGLDKAWREVAKASGDIAKKAVERLEAALERTTARLTAAHQELDSIRQRSGGGW